MDINQGGSVTDTVTGGFVVELGALNAAIAELQSAGFVTKAEKAEQVVLVMREVMQSICSEVVALRKGLEHMKRYGLGDYHG